MKKQKKQFKLLKIWIEKNWGKRCEGRCPLCALCQAWDAYDFLTLAETDLVPPCCPPGTQTSGFDCWEDDGGTTICSS